nr:dolichyl-phosphate beta-glucosyltransferase [Onthophagus taurus]
MEDYTVFFYYISAFLASAVISGWLILISSTNAYPNIIRTKKEKYFRNPITGENVVFPTLNENPTLDLSVIVPAYNEEERLCPMLDECIEFLEGRFKSTAFKYEIIIVNDGSKDKTVQVAEKYCKKLGVDKFRILDLEYNRGKGGAVRLGIQCGRGSLLLFVDADGATKFADFDKVEKKLFELISTTNSKDSADKLAMSIGSRSHLQDEAVAERSLFRTILMYGFHFLVWLFAVRTIKDTQCGFKLFTRKTAKLCFESLHVERWAFDVELLYIAEKLKIPIAEVAVNWTEIDGSKITPFWSWVQMGVDLGLIWLRYTTTAWKIKAKEDLK